MLSGDHDDEDLHYRHSTDHHPKAPLLSSHMPSSSILQSPPYTSSRKQWRGRATSRLSRVMSFIDDSTRAGMLLSRRAWIIYALFFTPPFFLTLLWLLIPLFNYPAYCFSISLYYAFAFLAWISFYSILIISCFPTCFCYTFDYYFPSFSPLLFLSSLPRPFYSALLSPSAFFFFFSLSTLW